jgi:hypothetical protein
LYVCPKTPAYTATEFTTAVRSFINIASDGEQSFNEVGQFQKKVFHIENIELYLSRYRQKHPCVKNAVYCEREGEGRGRGRVVVKESVYVRQIKEGKKREKEKERERERERRETKREKGKEINRQRERDKERKRETRKGRDKLYNKMTKN